MTALDRRTVLRSSLVAGTAAFLGPGLASLPARATTPTSGRTAADSVVTGDALIPDHSFESGLDGWTMQHGRDGAPLPPECADQIGIVTDFAKTGKNSARLVRSARCPTPALQSGTVPVRAGETYTGFVTATTTTGAIAIGLRFFD
ncbi:MAG TPA: hypothetical protein VI076_05380, partial [Actinopolymorphaceae bacterium]